MQRLLLAVEVLSPSSTRADRFTKCRLYQEQGLPLYWMVDAEQRVVEEWTPELAFPRVGRERVIWRPAGVGEPLAVELEGLFEPI